MDKEWQRFWAKVEVIPGGCWLWTAGKYTNGYGAFYPSGLPRRSALAHRWLYQKLVGPIPEGLDLDHLCRVRHCVNPEHLEPVTRSENLLRSPLMGQSQTAKTHCPQGHPYSGENLIIDAAGRRLCRACRLDHKRRYNATVRSDPERRAASLEADADRARRYRARLNGGVSGTPNGEKTHCPNGHEYSGDNLILAPSGARKCRECSLEANRRAYQKRKSQT